MNSDLPEDLPLLQGPFPCPVQLGAVLRSMGCVQSVLGGALAPFTPNCVLHSPGCLMNVFVNFGL